MNTTHLRRLMKAGKTGTCRPLRPGELIEPADVAVADTYIEGVSQTSVGQPCKEKETILRFEFGEGLGHQGGYRGKA